MRSARRRFAVGLCLLVILTLAACGNSEVKENQAKAAKTATDWAGLQQKKQQLDAKRQEYRQVRDMLAEAEDDASRSELQTRTDALKSEVDSLTAELGSQLADFINSQEIEVGAALTEVQQQALHFNSDEAIANAQEYVDSAGDWQRAIDIYEQALESDPGYDKLKEMISNAEQMRYMTKERFDLVKKKMTQNEVRKVLGQVKLSNIREFPEKQVVGWFYPKKEGGAAGVYFRERTKGEGSWEVYEVDFEAVKSRDAAGAADASPTP